MRNLCTIAIGLWVGGLVSCHPAWQHTDAGLQFRIFHAGGGQPVRVGSTVKVNYIQYVHDTVTRSTYDKMPYYKELIPGLVFPYDPMAVLVEGAREGDSLVVEQRVDSLVRKGVWKKLPPGYQSSDKVITRIKVLRVFDGPPTRFRQTDSLLQADKRVEWEKRDSMEQIQGPLRVEAYLKKHQIQAEKTAVGTYLQVLRPGSGDRLDTGEAIRLKFTLATLTGKILNSNIDTSFHNQEPLKITVGRSHSIQGIDQTLPLLKKGAHVKIYIPAMLAYGSQHQRSGTADYEDIVLEAFILDGPSTP